MQKSFNKDSQILFSSLQSWLPSIYFYQTSFNSSKWDWRTKYVACLRRPMNPLTLCLIALQNLVMWVNHTVTAVAWQQRKAPRSLVGWDCCRVRERELKSSESSFYPEVWILFCLCSNVLKSFFLSFFFRSFILSLFLSFFGVFLIRPSLNPCLFRSLWWPLMNSAEQSEKAHLKPLGSTLHNYAYSSWQRQMRETFEISFVLPCQTRQACIHQATAQLSSQAGRSIGANLRPSQSAQ